MNKRKPINFLEQTSHCYFLNPLINSVELGEQICLTAFYIPNKDQQIINGRMESSVFGNFIGFDVNKYEDEDTKIEAKRTKFIAQSILD